MLWESYLCCGLMCNLKQALVQGGKGGWKGGHIQQIRMDHRISPIQERDLRERGGRPKGCSCFFSA